MPAGGAHEGAEEYQAIGDTRDLGQKLGDLESVELGRDGGEGAAYLGGRIGLGVDEVHLRRPSVEMKVDDRLVGRTDPGNGLGPEKIGQGETTYAKRPDTQKTTPVEPDVSCKSDHERISPTS
jgi:hypothetical protein